MAARNNYSKNNYGKNNYNNSKYKKKKGAGNKDHSFKTIGKDLKEGRIKSPVILYGREQYLVNWACDLLRSHYLADGSAQMDEVVLQDEAISADAIISSCETFSLFSSKRIVIVKDWEAFRKEPRSNADKEAEEQLIDYFKNINEETLLIFRCSEVKTTRALFKAAAKHGCKYEFDTLDEKTLSGFIGKRLSTAGPGGSEIRIHRSAFTKYINECGYFNKESDYTLYDVINDIDKMAAHCDDGIITSEDVEAVVSKNIETNIFKMLDAVSRGRKDEALFHLNEIWTAETNAGTRGGLERYLSMMIARQFENILNVKELRSEGMNQQEIMKTTGIKEYPYKKTLPLINRYSTAQLKDILTDAYQIEWQIHSGMLEPRLAYEMFLAGL